ncbi:MAG: hypothetical protein IPI91_04610 [Flavobacteriales bacterium]|nr:hypothetical protein [Flavobacteriales bacterium]
MSKSPYLSTEALFETVSKNILPNAIVLEICLANPEATSKEGFVKWMEYEAPTPMPEYMLGVIEASWHSKTVRFYMEEAIGIHSSNMSHGTSILVQNYTPILSVTLWIAFVWYGMNCDGHPRAMLKPTR